jgi:tRNA A58 N-methylase Trm61
LRLINPSFVESSGVYAAIALLGHEDIHFCVEFVEKMKRAHREHRWIHEMAEIIGNRYGVTNLATEPPTRAPGYMKDIEFLTFSCRQA